MWKDERVSIVFPAYNEEEAIGDAVASFQKLGVVDEIVVVDNNSRDRTAELARAAGARVVPERQQGYGFALQRGLREATGDLVVLVEPDGTFAAEDLWKLLAYSDDADVVLGSRTARELISEDANMGPFLRWGNWSVAKLLQVLFRTCSLTDCGCTFRVIRRRALEQFQDSLSIGSSHFLPEIVILARLSGASMIEVPVKYRARRGTSKITGSYLGSVKVGLNMVGLIARYRATSLGARRRAPRLQPGEPPSPPPRRA